MCAENLILIPICFGDPGLAVFETQVGMSDRKIVINEKPLVPKLVLQNVGHRAER
jgi:hypothetical protein